MKKTLNKIKNMGKRTLANALILGALASPVSALAQDKTPTNIPERKITLDIANPLDSSEANTKAWYSANQIIGKTSDVLGEKYSLDNNILKRVGVFGSHFVLSEALKHASHELAHIREGKRYGDYVWSFKLKNILDFGGNFQKEFNYIPTDEQKIKERISGLNQDELNANFLARNNKDNLTFDNATSFLLSKLWDIKYNLNSEEDIDYDDVENYVELLNKKGIDMSKKEHLINSLVADFSSMYTWDSLKSIYNYLAKGERSTELSKFKIKDTEFTFPLVSHYLTPEGSFYDIQSTINSDKKNSIEASVGIGLNDVDRLRFGAQYNNIKLGKGRNVVKLNPFGYVNTDKSLDYEGVSVGTEASLPIMKNVDLSAKAEYNKNDLIENTVKGKDEGVNLTVGLETRF